jgi:hypothetical protein
MSAASGGRGLAAGYFRVSQRSNTKRTLSKRVEVPTASPVPGHGSQAQILVRTFQAREPLPQPYLTVSDLPHDAAYFQLPPSLVRLHAGLHFHPVARTQCGAHRGALCRGSPAYPFTRNGRRTASVSTVAPAARVPLPTMGIVAIHPTDTRVGKLRKRRLGPSGKNCNNIHRYSTRS